MGENGRMNVIDRPGKELDKNSRRVVDFPSLAHGKSRKKCCTESVVPK